MRKCSIHGDGNNCYWNKTVKIRIEIARNYSFQYLAHSKDCFKSTLNDIWQRLHMTSDLTHVQCSILRMMVMFSMNNLWLSNHQISLIEWNMIDEHCSAFNTENTSEWLKYGEQISSEKYLIKWDEKLSISGIRTHSIRLSCCISLMYIYFRYWNCKYSNRFSGIEENTNIEKKLLIYKQISVSSGEHR